jgi:GDP-6-deoxy-D-talose 4-dehydrogenase
MGMRRALVSGLDGFTGYYMARELEAAGWEVHGFGGRAVDSPRHRVLDLSDQRALREMISEVQPQAVIHLAGVAFVGHGEAKAFYDVNLVGTRNLLEALAAEAKSLSCVLLASSANVYGNCSVEVITEDVPPEPANDYAVSKLAMEYMAKLWADRLPLVVARPFNYTGVGQSDSFLIPKIISHFRKRAQEIELGSLDVFRDFNDVRAVVNAYRQLVEIAPVGETLNVCSGRLTSLRDVIEMAEALAGYSIRVKVNPAFVRANEVRSLCGSTAKLRSVIGAWEVPLLEDTLSWMYRADRS